MRDHAPSLIVLKKDKRMRSIILKFGPPRLKRPGLKKGHVFGALLRAIIYQQLSGRAAGAIHRRVLTLFPHEEPTPERLLKISAKKLRAAGLSVQKIAYVRDLARKYLDGTIDEKRFKKMSSDEVIEHVTSVHGIGEWTAHMLLIFTLGRLDILPVGDLGVRKGFQLVYGLKLLPDKKQMEKIASPWRSHASIGAWYLWQVADAAKKSEYTDW